jgi:hypothetical protein
MYLIIYINAKFSDEQLSCTDKFHLVGLLIMQIKFLVKFSPQHFNNYEMKNPFYNPRQRFWDC